MTLINSNDIAINNCGNQKVVTTTRLSKYLRGAFSAVYNKPTEIFFTHVNSADYIPSNYLNSPDPDYYKSLVDDLNYKASINGYQKLNDTVKTTAHAILSFFDVHHVGLVYKTPLHEGGIGFEFTFNNIYYNIKIDNDGDGVFYKEQNGFAPQGWDLTFPELLKHIKQEFNDV